MSEVRTLIEKAARSFDTVENLLEASHADFAASRAYYGCFYAAEALLLDVEPELLDARRMIGEYGRLFAKTGRLDRRSHRLLNRSFQARQSANYDTDFDLTGTDVRELIEDGGAFLGAARDYLERGDGSNPLR